MFYLDTCVLAAYYCPEPLSTAVTKVLTRLPGPAISGLVEVELASALALKVRTRELARAGATAVLELFRQHRRDGYYRLVDIGPREHALAAGWLARFSTPLRALDALHLAAAAAHKLDLITTDKTLAKAAKQLRVKCRLIGV